MVHIDKVLEGLEIIANAGGDYVHVRNGVIFAADFVSVNAKLTDGERRRLNELGWAELLGSFAIKA